MFCVALFGYSLIKNSFLIGLYYNEGTWRIVEKTKSVTKLLHDIETNRQTLNELAMTEKLQSQTLLIQSQKLDELINEYQYITKKL